MSGVRGGGGFFEEVFVCGHFVPLVDDQSEPSGHKVRGRDRESERERESERGKARGS